jgi:regulator of RNase E activity RraA
MARPPDAGSLRSPSGHLKRRCSQLVVGAGAPVRHANYYRPTGDANLIADDWRRSPISDRSRKGRKIMDVDRISREVLDLLRQISTATISSQLNKRGLNNCFMNGVAPLRPDLRMAGQAFTLRYLPMREDLDRGGTYDNRTNKQRIAVESVGPGDVLVIDARGDTRAASLGNILCARIRQRGAAGIVTDGAFRDTPAIKRIELPTYARGQNPNISFTVHHPIDIGLPIACGGVAVLPGDVVVGDGEGVIVIPRALADEVARDAYEQERREEFIYSKIEAGSSIVGVYPPNDATLQEYEQYRRGRNEA